MNKNFLSPGGLVVRTFSIFMVVVSAFAFKTAATAQSTPPTVEIVNIIDNNSGRFLTFDNGRMTLNDTPTDETAWELRFLGNEEGKPYFRLSPASNTDVSLHNQDGPLKVGPISPNWYSAMWIRDPALPGTSGVSFRNRWTFKVLTIRPPSPGGAETVMLAPRMIDGRDIDTSVFQWQLQSASLSRASSPNILSTDKPERVDPNSVIAELQSAPQIFFYVENYTDEPVDLHFDMNGDTEKLTTIPPLSGVEQATPVGATWRLLSRGRWVSQYTVGDDLDQRWKYGLQN